jgi:1-acyl-sn-glycerol-3-phosphate acyltransferase
MLFCVGSFIYNMICALLFCLPGRSHRIGFHRKLNHHLVRLHIDFVRFIGVMDLKPRFNENDLPKNGCVMIANHTGLFDAVVINYLVPEMVCVFKGKLGKHPCFSFILKCSGHISNDDGIDVIRNASESLNKNSKVLVFPEGTRQATVDAFEFKGGFAMMAQRTKKPIALVAISNPEGAFSKELGMFRVPGLPFEYVFDYLGTVEPSVEDHPATTLDRVLSRYKNHFSKDALSSELSSIHQP